MNLTRRVLALSLLASSLAVVACGAAADTGDDIGQTGSALSESANNKTAFDFFVGKGLTKVQAAGIVGNLDQESTMNPSIAQPGGPGRGIAQWSEGGRWNADHDDNVEWYAHAKHDSIYSLTLQLDFIWYELETFHGYGLARLRDATNITSATVAFEEDFEECHECDQSNRINYAEEVFAANGGHSSGGGRGCYSDTLGREEPDNACVQARSNDEWYQCDDGDWVDRWTDPSACNGIHAL